MNTEIILNNMEYVTGYRTETQLSYLVASNCVNITSDYANFGIRIVMNGYVFYDNLFALCRSNSDYFEDADIYLPGPVRPVVVLPSDLKVVEKDGGGYDLDK